jgi:hypothetical protein
VAAASSEAIIVETNLRNPTVSGRDDPVHIAEQLGHRSARFTYRVYQRAAKQRERLIGAHLAAFDRALEWAGMGRQTSHEPTPGQLTGESAALQTARSRGTRAPT